MPKRDGKAGFDAVVAAVYDRRRPKLTTPNFDNDYDDFR
jgi:hypothetical protein